MPHEITYSQDSKILIRTSHGIVNFNEVMDSWKLLIRQNMIGENTLGIINDFSDAMLQMDQENLDQLMIFFQNYPEIFERIKLAVVMTTPENIILPILANKKYPQYKIEAFSSFNAAEEWMRE